MNNQSVGPGNTGNFLHLMGVLLMAAFVRIGYELGQPKPAGNKNPALLLPDNTNLDSPEQEWVGLLLWQRRASEKSVEKYAATQEKKWRNWNEAMFERPTDHS